MSPRRAVASLVLAAATLVPVACGDGTPAFCAPLAEQADLDDLATALEDGDLTAADAEARRLRDLADEAPEEIRSDFRALADAVVDVVDLVLVMTVNPGFGGQAYIETMEPKIAEVAAMIEFTGRDIDLEVDGGIGPSTVAGAAGAGADVLVAGSALYRDPEGLAHAVSEIRALAEAARA